MANRNRFLNFIFELYDDWDFKFFAALLFDGHLLVRFRPDHFVLKFTIRIWKFEGDCFEELGHIFIVLSIIGPKDAAPLVADVWSFDFGILAAPVVLPHFIGVAYLKNNTDSIAEEEVLLLQKLKLFLILLWKMRLQLLLMTLIYQLVFELLDF